MAQAPETRGYREDKPLSIAQLNWHVKNLIEGNLPPVWVEGEIADLSQPSSGHIYFSLKDEQSQMRSVIWRSTASRIPFDLKDGMSIVCRGSVEVYLPRGSYQLIIDRMEPKGVGPLQLAFQQLHAKLSAQGLFADDRKKPLPSFPKRIGFVTSPSGAAISDFLQASHDLWPTEVIVIPSRVQGEAAAMEIARGIRQAQKMVPALDILVVGRGGGSVEDLWCFNDERVVRAIANASLPVVSAVGHEIDVTLSDLVADLRALTPTHAAHAILPNPSELDGRLRQLGKRLQHGLRNRALRARSRLEAMTQRSVLARPHEIHQQHTQYIDELGERAREAALEMTQEKRRKISELARAAEALSPLSVLSRGYSITLDENRHAVRSTKALEVGNSIITKLSDGVMESVIQKIDDT
ncbi:MAG: exodeoxyribonuclease VII large subunit [Aureliella sp.]